MATASPHRKRLIVGAAGLAIALMPAVAGLAGPSGQPPRVLACQDTEVEDSFSLDCAPPIYPDTSDPLTEAEVAQPGWNAVPGGRGAGNANR